MKIKVSVFVFCLTMMGASASTVWAQTELVIDNFKESPYQAQLWNQSIWLTKYQPGSTLNIIGGVRQASFSVTRLVPDVGQSTRLQVRPDGYLVISGDYKSYFGLYLGYGYDEEGGTPGLNVNLSGYGSECPDCDRIRIMFDGSDSELSYVVQVYDRNRHIASFFTAESTNRYDAFHLDAPFAEFVQDPSQPVDWEHIDFIFVLFQSGNVLGSHDFVVTKISAIPNPTP